MIGVFDSGYGGLTILKELVRAFSARSFVYLGDNKRAPYGSLPAEIIYEYTKQGVEFLFAQGCNLVILACNTASAVALRKLQQEWLPHTYPLKRILGIIVPTIEQITGTAWADDAPNHTPPYKTIGILATEKTVQSGAYETEIKKRAPNMTVLSIACSKLVPLIEQNSIEQNSAESIIKNEIRKYLHELWTSTTHLDALVLGCTHYQLIKDIIQHEIPPHIPLFDQPTVVAHNLKTYLLKHPDIDNEKSSPYCIHWTTGDARVVSHNAQQFWGKPLTFQQIKSSPM